MDLRRFDQVASPRGREAPPHRRAAWWNEAARDCADDYSRASFFPAMGAAAAVYGWLYEGADGPRADSSILRPTPGFVYAQNGHDEVLAAVAVVGYIDKRPDAALLDDRTLASAAVQWSYRDGDPDCPWGQAAIRGASELIYRRELPEAPWWRAARIWPDAQDIDLFAVACEFLWRHRSDINLHTAPARARALCDESDAEYKASLFDRWGWALREPGLTLVLPRLTLHAVLAEVISPDARTWPWPYCWMAEADTDRGRSQPAPAT